MGYIKKYNLQINSTLYEFINKEVIPETNIKSDDFWYKFEKAVHELAPINKDLIKKREDIQKNNKFAGLQVNYIPLKTNFRSKPKIINWMNQNLKEIFPSQLDPDLDAITYHSCEPYRDNNNNENDGVVTIHRFSSIYSKGNDLYKAEAKETIRIIKDIKKKHPKRKIAVLTRTRSNIQEVLSELKKEEEIGVKAIEIKSIEDRQSFQDILSLSKA